MGESSDAQRWVHCHEIVEQSLARHRDDLAPLLAGDVLVGERIPDGQWRDITPAVISLHHHHITVLETLLALLSSLRGES